MKRLSHLFANNSEWVERRTAEDPEFFASLAKQQDPEYVWIGCSDSRVPANEIVGLPPGELFVHRNVANVVVHTDLNCLSVLQYAVEVLKVKHVIVCGHYGCGGVMAVLSPKRLGLIDNWLRHVGDVYEKHKTLVLEAKSRPAQVDRLCELNVIEQVMNVCATTIVQDAWVREQSLTVHGWIYGLSDGRISDLGMTVSNFEELESVYASSLSDVSKAKLERRDWRGEIEEVR